MSRKGRKVELTEEEANDFKELRRLVKDEDSIFCIKDDTPLEEIEDSVEFIITPHNLSKDSQNFNITNRVFRKVAVKVYTRDDEEKHSMEILEKYGVVPKIRVKQRKVEYEYVPRIKPNDELGRFVEELKTRFPEENYFSEEENFVSKFNDYIRFVFGYVFRSDTDDTQRNSFIENFVSEVCSPSYKKIFLKCVISEGISEDANWELFENIGDKKLLSLFNDYVTSNFANITPEIVTNMLQYYMSKIAQAEVCEMIGLSKFIAVDREVRVGDKEDVYEAFFAVLDKVQTSIMLKPNYRNFGCEDLAQFYTMFPPNFILDKIFTWIYSNIEIELSKGKPAKTILIEIGYLFNKEGKRDGFKLVKGESYCTTSITDDCATELAEAITGNKSKVSKEDVIKACTAISFYKPNDNQDFKQLQKDTQYYLNEDILNSLYELGLTQDVLNKARNKRNLLKWTPEDSTNFTRLMSSIPYVLQYRNITSDPSNDQVYWKLEFSYNNKKYVYTTKHISLETQYLKIIDYVRGVLNRNI